MAEIANKEEKKKDPGTRESPEEKGQEERERITRRKKMMEKRIRKARLMRGMLCLGLVALCVCTGVLAVSLMGKGGQGKKIVPGWGFESFKTGSKGPPEVGGGRPAKSRPCVFRRNRHKMRNRTFPTSLL